MSKRVMHSPSRLARIMLNLTNGNGKLQHAWAPSRPLDIAARGNNRDSAVVVRKEWSLGSGQQSRVLKRTLLVVYHKKPRHSRLPSLSREEKDPRREWAWTLLQLESTLNNVHCQPESSKSIHCRIILVDYEEQRTFVLVLFRTASTKPTGQQQGLGK